MQSRFVILAVTLVAALAAGVGASASVGAAPGQPSLAFVSDRGGQRELWTMGVDGSSPGRVTSDDVPPVSLTWTADGTRLVLVSPDSVLAVGADGSSPVTLAPAYPVQPGGTGVSPDGSSVAFLTSRAGCLDPDAGCELVVARTDGTGRTVLSARSAGAVGWSPDGRQVAFEAHAGGSSEVWRAAADGSGATRVVGGLAGAQSLAWLADGTLVLVVGFGIAPDVFLLRPGDTEPSRLQESSCGDSCWVERSPDGTRFFVLSNSLGPDHLRVYDLAGTGVATVLSGRLGRPTWSPDSRSLVFGYCDFSLGQFPPGPCEVQRLDLGTGGATRLLAGPDAMPLQGAFWYGGASFAPDGSRLAVSSLAASGTLQITTLAPDGTSPTTLTSGANDTLPAWQPRVPDPPDVGELAPDPGFEAAPAGTWAPVHQRGGRASFTWTTDPVHGGDHALSITSSRSSTSLARWITSVPIPVRAGQALRCEGWLKAVRVAGSGRLDMTFHDRNGAYVPDSAVSSADDGQVVTGTRDWTKLTFRDTAPPKAASVRIEIRLYGTGTLVADDVSLTAG